MSRERPVSVQPDLLNGTELAQKLGYSETQFLKFKREGKFRMFEVKRPLGQRRYSRALVEQYLAGESTVAIGGRR